MTVGDLEAAGAVGAVASRAEFGSDYIVEILRAPTWTMATSLTPNKQFTWKLRAEYQGAVGPWSTTASFASPDPPPAYEVLGDWQSCGLRTKKLDLVMCVWAVVKPGNSVGDMEVVKRVAWLLRIRENPIRALDDLRAKSVGGRSIRKRSATTTQNGASKRSQSGSSCTP